MVPVNYSKLLLSPRGEDDAFVHRTTSRGVALRLFGVNSGFKPSHFRGLARATLEHHEQHCFATNTQIPQPHSEGNLWRKNVGKIVARF